MKSFFYKSIGCVCGITLLALTAAGAAAPQGEETFPSPDAAIKALAGAVKKHDTNALHAIFGPELRTLVSTDAVQASNHFQVFARRMAERVKQTTVSDDKITLQLGYEGWPFAIPLVKHGNDWVFDTAAGREEILNRRIGEDELGAISVCHSYVDAQHEYASADRMGDGVLQYAQFLRSNPGKHDGLYWHVAPGGDLSPFGPLIAESHSEGYHKAKRILTTEQSPYHGYYFKILTKQGKHAPAGKFSYLIHGRMVAGFALVAWPAKWGNSGIMTFIVNQEGKVYEKNLGPNTASAAARMTTFDPDSSWKTAWEP